LFAKFYAALDEINFFKTSPAGAEDPGQLSKASQFFDDALLVWCTFFFALLAFSGLVKYTLYCLHYHEKTIQILFIYFY
jgi:hypothetical protein